MPFNVRRTAQFYDKEILKFPTGLDAIKSGVLDGMEFAYVADSRNVVPAGTILKFSLTNTDKYVPYNGTGTIAGILARPIDFLSQATASSEPVPILFHQAVFATPKIVGFTLYASALVNTLNTCKFE